MDETIRFASYLTGHDEETIKQMYKDWQSSPNIKANPLDCVVGMPETNQQLFTIKDIKKLLEQQRVICSQTYFNKEQTAKTYGDIMKLINNAKEPKIVKST